jgi:hypothetical protein
MQRRRSAKFAGDVAPSGKSISRTAESEKTAMPKERLELSWGHPRAILSRVRLPFRHFGRHPHQDMRVIKKGCPWKATLRHKI